MEDLTTLRRRRKVLRSSLTKTCNELEDELQQDSVNEDRLAGLLSTLTLRFEALSQKDSAIGEILYQDKDLKNADLEAEQKGVDQYSVKYFEVHHKAQKVLSRSEVETTDCKSVPNQSTTSGQVDSKQSRYKLPTMKLKEFNGTLSEWLPFWSQFQKIHEDCTLDNSDKMGYLIMSMTPGSPAKQLVESYPATGSMYPTVVQAFQARYGREDLLVEYYIRELLRIVIHNNVSSEKLPLVTLYDKLQSHLRNLESLKITSNMCAPFLMPLVSSCLSEDVLKLWERSCSAVSSSDSTSKDHLESLMQFLKAEVEGAQKLELAKSGFGLTSTKTPVKPIHTPRRDFKMENKQCEVAAKVSTAAGLVNTPPRGESCLFCTGNHNPQDCNKSMTLSQKLDIVRNKQVCFACLKYGHRVSRCRLKAKLSCQNCKGKHHTVLCPRESDAVTNSFVNTKPSNVLLQTLVVKIKGVNNKKQSRHARLMIDTGSQQSYVLDKTVSSLGYTPLRKESMRHALFGGSVTNTMEHNVYNIVIANLDDTFVCDFNVYGQNEICSPIPSIPPGPWMEELKQHAIQLSDVRHPTATIDILIGADIAASLWTGNRVVLSSGLVAMETCLGWTLSGKMPSVS
uniref:Peptidase aspartic putative domain-containing protein n=1 Tax=Cacopsylla melanoneura TaxID=428564 RepID=A0A8D8QBF3_9HEMI